MSLTDQFCRNLDLLYYGEVRIGIPAKSLTVQVDTGSVDFWVPAGCPKFSRLQFKPEHSRMYETRKEPPKSITFVLLISQLSVGF